MEGISDSVDVTLSKLRETVRDREAWRAAVCGAARVCHGQGTEPPPQVSYFIFLTASFFVYKVGIIVPTLWGYCEKHTEHLTQCLVYRKPLINSNYRYYNFDSYYKVQV